VKIEHEEDKQQIDKVEKILKEVFQMIPDNTLTRELNVIVQKCHIYASKTLAHPFSSFPNHIVEVFFEKLFG
jgi:hypothetical protein